jgi:hypothetical protein
MTREQLARLFFRLIKTVPLVELHHAVRYAIEGDYGRRPEDEAAALSRKFADQLCDEVERMATPSVPEFPTRDPAANTASVCRRPDLPAWVHPRIDVPMRANPDADWFWIAEVGDIGPGSKAFSGPFDTRSEAVHAATVRGYRMADGYDPFE